MAPEADILLEGWMLTLRASGHSDASRDTYRNGVLSLSRFVHPTPLSDVTKADVRRWVADLIDRGRTPATVATYVRAAKLFYAWAVDEGDVDKNPADGVATPQSTPDTPCLSDDDIAALLKAASGPGMFERRDQAILRLLLDAGLRVGGVAGMLVEDIHPDGLVVVREKGAGRAGKRRRTVVVGSKTQLAINRWMRIRNTKYTIPEVWVSRIGGRPLTTNGIYQMVARRGEAAGIPGLHPHVLRHTWAHNARLSGMSEGDLMILGGWTSRDQLDRYGAAGAAERAVAAARQHSLSDRF